jgi:hypothetical protein
MHQQENPSGGPLRKTLCYALLLVSFTLYLYALTYGVHWLST